MVKYQVLDDVFTSLSDPTRRDMLRRLRGGELSVSVLAAPYRISLPAVSKHLRVLEDAKLVRRRRRGRTHFIALSVRPLKNADAYLQRYRELWEERLDRLEAFLKR